MITFKSTEDLAKLSPTDHAYTTVKELVDRLISEYTTPGRPYNHEDYGYVILIQECDVDRDLDEIWDVCRLTQIPWESITRRDSFYTAIYLANNEYGLVFVIPDAPWVNGELRELINDILDPALPRSRATPAQRSHLLAIERAGHEAEAFVHTITLFPRHLRASPNAELCNLCARNTL